MRFALLVAVLSFGCRATDATPPPETKSAAATPAVEEAQALFAQLCSVCHGAGGRGDGPGAAALTPKPRNYTDKAWQSSVTDEQIAKTILLGGAGVGKSPNMPAQPQLKDKPEVVAALVAIVRSFGK